jgi:hypothetical protein
VAVARGNGKTTLLGGNGIYGSAKDSERGADVYLMAILHKAGGRMFLECKKMIESSPVLAKRFRTLSDVIYYDPTYSSQHDALQRRREPAGPERPTWRCSTRSPSTCSSRRSRGPSLLRQAPPSR